MDFVKADGRDRREAVLDQLLSFIARQKDVAGMRLPPEGELAEMFDVSRTVIREAMRSLQATGVVRIEQGRGTFVSEHPFSQPFSVWASLNAHRVTELFEMRVILEGESASRAAAQASKPELPALEATLESCFAQAEAGDWSGTMASDREFHRLVTRMAGLPMLEELLEVTVPSWMQITAKFGDESNRETRIRFVIREHRAVYDAICQGDPVEARNAMQRHLHNALQRRLKHDRAVLRSAPVEAGKMGDRTRSTPKAK